ncbi:MAG: permease prefix domain 1-containing protein [Candidatus Limnocylindrales bacterium]
MNEPPGIEARLAAHVESILNGASFRKGDRQDLSEELYGHLWQRWQDALASGLDEEAAADEAIRSFGEPSRLGRDVTFAYHSRLYASTIGVLVPTVADAKGKPRAYWVICFLLFTTFWAMAYGQAEALMSWTPLRAAIGFSGTLTAFIAASLVFQAYRARQRWTLRFVGLELALLFWWLGVLWWANQPGLPASLVGATAGLGIACVAFSWPPRPLPLSSWRDLRLRSLSAWMYERPVPRRLLVGLGAMMIVGSAMPAVALSLHDPTQIGPADMQVELSVACTRGDSGDVRAVEVTASFVFRRTDVWPNGLVNALQGSGPTDEIALAVEGGRPAGGPMITPMLTQAAAARDTTDGSTLALGSGGQDGRSLLTIPGSANLQAGHRYEVTWNYSVAPGLRDRDLTPVTFGYDHLERFYLQATAGCGQTAVGHTVSQLYVIGP